MEQVHKLQLDLQAHKMALASFTLPMRTKPSHFARQFHCPIARSLAGILAAASMTACEAKAPTDAATAPSASAQAASTANANPQFRALLGKTLKNLRFVEGGTFQMGDFGPLHSPDKRYYSTESDNKPLHKVTLDSFSMSAYKTTFSDIDIYSGLLGKQIVANDELTKRYRRPDVAVGLTWQHARDYCQRLGKQLDLSMDLPTEAQWEYAARNRGQFFVFATDNGKVEPGRNVWEYEQRQDYIRQHDLQFPGPSLELGRFPPTPLGLYDMMTDGFEWTSDWYDPMYYASSPEKNPRGPDKGKEKVLRSTRSRDGDGLSYGDGLTIARAHREPDPPKIDISTGKVDPKKNMTTDTMARCVVNSPSPVSPKSR